MIAALHTGHRQTRREIIGRLLTAMENENVDIIAHPTGRIIGKRQEYDVDIEVLLDAAARTGTVLEINAHPARLDLSDINSRKMSDLKPENAKKKETIAQFMEKWGGRYSTELGIDIDSRRSGEIFKWFLASILFGARISQAKPGRLIMNLKSAKSLLYKPK